MEQSPNTYTEVSNMHLSSLQKKHAVANSLASLESQGISRLDILEAMSEIAAQEGLLRLSEILTSAVRECNNCTPDLLQE